MALRSSRCVAFPAWLILPLALACGSDTEAPDNPQAPRSDGAPPAAPVPPGEEGVSGADDRAPAQPESSAPGTGAASEEAPGAIDLSDSEEVGGDEGAAEGGGGEAPSETGEEPPVEAVDPVPELGAPFVEDSGAECPRPALPAPNQLPNIEAHPDPFRMTDGTRITTRAQWTCRRAEIKAQVEQYESGPKPAVAPENVTGQFQGNQLTVGVSEGDRNVTFNLNINRPNGASEGPIPLLIGIGGSSLDNSVFSQNGVATANLANNAMGAQAGGGSRGTGVFYDLYGSNHPASSMIAWAWGVSRVIDALEKTPEAGIDTQRIAVTGCSRNGKGALTVGAFDERIALTIPQESGAGGSASWRVSQAGANTGENVQTLSSAANEQPWFRANFGQNFSGNNVTRLPFDHHTVMGMVAPRALLVVDNEIDWLGIDSSFTAGSIAHEIWEAFDEGDSMGYWQTSAHQHCAYPQQQRAVLDAYVKKFLLGDDSVDTNVLRGDSASADLNRWLDWEPPALQ